MFLSFNTSELTEQDRAILTLIANASPTVTTEQPVAAEPVAAEPVTTKAPKKAPVTTEQPVAAEPVAAEPVATKAPKKAPVAAEPVAEPVATVTREDAVRKVTELVAKGAAPAVKGVLSSFDAKKVSDLTDDQISGFVEALAEIA